jgi:hypothetical protein
MRMRCHTILMPIQSKRKVGNDIVVRVNRKISVGAANLCRVHPLRAHDAVQVACALTRRVDNLAVWATCSGLCWCR